MAEQHSTRHWECVDGGRHCSEPCDYCRANPQCRCELLSEEEPAGWCVRTGYVVPSGFSMCVRLVNACGESGQEVAVVEAVVYRAVCGVCGVESGGLDRERKLEEWLREHKGCRPEWLKLNASDFDFTVDQTFSSQVETSVREGRGACEGNKGGEAFCWSAGNDGCESHCTSGPQGFNQLGLPKPEVYGRAPERGHVGCSGEQVWGAREYSKGGSSETAVSYQTMSAEGWRGIPYRQPCGWVPLSNPLSFRSL